MFKKHGVKCPRCDIVFVIHNWFYYEWFLLLFWFDCSLLCYPFFCWFLIFIIASLVNLLGLLWVLFLWFASDSMYLFNDVAFCGRFYINAICCLRYCSHVFGSILKMKFWTFFCPVISQLMRWMWESLR